MYNEKLCYYQCDKDKELYEYCYVGNKVLKDNEASRVAEELAKEIYAQSCGDHPFPTTLSIHDENKKFIGTYIVSVDMEPYFSTEKLKPTTEEKTKITTILQIR